MFLLNALTWNKIALLASNLLSFPELVVSEVMKSISKNIHQYSFVCPSYHCLMLIFQELITKELYNFIKVLISVYFYQSLTTILRTLGVKGIEMKMFERV